MLLAQLWLAGASLQGGAVLEQIRERPQEQGCEWATSGREQCQRVGSVAFPCSGQGWKDSAVFAVFWLYGRICMEKPTVVW